MMAVTKLHLEEPATVNLSSHRMRSVIPVVEISYQDNGCSSRGDAIEVDGIGRVSGAITIDAGRDRCRIHSGIVVASRFCDLLVGRCLRIVAFGLRALTSAAALRLDSRRAGCRAS